jgi:hypothetical protein
MATFFAQKVIATGTYDNHDLFHISDIRDNQGYSDYRCLPDRGGRRGNA